MNKHVIALISLLAMPAPGAQAAEPTPSAVPESPWRLGVALGYGQRSNPLAFSDDITIVVDLDIAWFGRRWFFDNGDLGITLLDRDAFTLNLIGRLNSDRVFFSRTDSELVSVIDNQGVVVTEQVEVPDRDYALEAGLELLTDGDWGYLQVAAHQDVSGVHDGYELYLNYGRGFRAGRWLFEPSIGASWKGEELNDYYWGVRESEAGVAFPAYRAGAGVNGHARFATRYLIDRHWAFVMVAEFERMNSEAAASPVVEDRDVRSAYAGFRYAF